MLFFKILPVSFFQISNDYCQISYGKTILFYNEFWGFYYVTNIFDLHTFDNETTALLKFIETSTEIHFVSLLFLNERNIATSLLMIHSKCTLVHYANLNSSSKNKPYLRAAKFVISFFFDFLFTFLLTRVSPKTLWKNYHFLIQMSKIHFKM